MTTRRSGQRPAALVPGAAHGQSWLLRSRVESDGAETGARAAGTDENQVRRASARRRLLRYEAQATRRRSRHADTTAWERRRRPSRGNGERTPARQSRSGSQQWALMPNVVPWASCRLHNAARLRLVTRFLPVTLQRSRGLNSPVTFDFRTDRLIIDLASTEPGIELPGDSRCSCSGRARRLARRFNGAGD